MVIKMKYQRIKDLREDSDLTQSQIGEKLNLPQRTYAYYESGERTIPPEILIKLADFYNTSIDYILGRTDKKYGQRKFNTPLSFSLFNYNSIGDQWSPLRYSKIRRTAVRRIL